MNPIKPVVIQATVYAYGHHVRAYQYPLDGIATLLLFIGNVQISLQGIPSEQADAIAAACEAVDVSGNALPPTGSAKP